MLDTDSDTANKDKVGISIAAPCVQLGRLHVNRSIEMSDGSKCSITLLPCKADLTRRRVQTSSKADDVLTTICDNQHCAFSIILQQTR